MSGFISGLRNCHLEGIDSMVIRERIDAENGMIRVFHNRACPQMMNLKQSDGRYTLSPHNHRQDIRLIAIRGNPVNVSFFVDRRSHDHYHIESRFGSAIVDGKLETHYRDCVDLYLQDAQIISESGVGLGWSEVHTVLSSPGDAWIVIEGNTAPEGSHSLCYTPTKNGLLVFDQSGLYEEMKEQDLRCSLRARLHYDAIDQIKGLKQ